MKKLKLVALLAVLALTVATFVTMLVMPASAAAVTDAGTDTKVYTGFADDSAALSAGCIGRYGDAQGTSVEYVKSIAGLLSTSSASDSSASRLGSSDKYLEFNLLVDLTTSVRLRFYNYDGSAIRTTKAVFDGNGHTITSTSTSAQHFRGTLTIKNLTITGSVDHLTQAASNGVVFGTGTTIENTKVNGNPMIVSGGVTVTVDGATFYGNTGTAGLIVPWGDNVTVNVKSGNLINKSTDTSIGPSGLSFANKQNATFNISGGTIKAERPINYPSNDCSASKLKISGGTLTEVPAASNTTNNGMVLFISSGTYNTNIEISGGTFNCDGVLVMYGDARNTCNTLKISGNPIINTGRASRGFVQDVGGGSNTVTISGGTINSAGFGIVAHGSNSKYEITGGTINVKNNFINLGAGSGQQIKIGGTAKIICGNSEDDHTLNLLYSSVAGVKPITIDGGTIYCGDIYEAQGSSDLVVDIKGGTFYTENVLWSGSPSATGELNIHGGDINCSNAVLYVTNGQDTVLNIYEGANINTKHVLNTRPYAPATSTAAAVEAASGIGKLRVYGGTINCSGNALNLNLGENNPDAAYASDVIIYDGDFTITKGEFISALTEAGAGNIDIYGGNFNLLDGWFVYYSNGGDGTVDVYGGTVLAERIAYVASANSKMTLNLHGGTFVSTYSGAHDGITDGSRSAGAIFSSASDSYINVYGGRYYIKTALSATAADASTGVHAYGWAGAKENVVVYGGEFYGGTHVFKSSNWSNNAAVTVNEVKTTNGKFLASPVTREGASIRVSADSMGIRFQSSISKSVLDHAKTFGTVKYGTIITPLDFGMKLGAALLNSSSNYVKIEATSAGTTTDANGNVTFNAALTNIQTANLGRQFVACAYIEITTTSGEVVTIYAVDKAIRSIDQVAKAALADYKTEAEITEGDKATYNRMTTIYCDKATNEMVYGGTPVYTRFNNAQISAIAKQIVVG